MEGKKMVSNNLINEFAQCLLLGWITEGIFLALFVTVILVLIAVLRQKRKSRLQSLLIYHNQKPKAEIQTAEHEEETKTRIEKLIYPITGNRQISDFLKEQSINSKNSEEQPNLEVMGHKQNESV
jgi:hypothetical protein